MKRKYWTSASDLPPLTDSEVKSMSDAIKEQLGKMRLTQVWLIQRLGERGLQTDKSEMSSILSGTRRGAKCDDILRASLILLGMEQTNG